MKRKVLQVIGIGFGVLALAATAFYVKVELTYRRDFTSTPLPAIQASKDPEVIERGRYVVHALAHCSACHGPGESANQRRLADDLDDLRGGYVMKAGPFGTFYPANLTPDTETGIGKLSDAELARVIRHGVSPEGHLDPLMSFAVGPMADEDLVGVVSYLRSIKPVKSPTQKDEWGFLAKALSSKFAPNTKTAPPYVPPPGPGGASAERGEYLANGPALCSGCHSPYDVAAGFELKGAKFSGEMEAEPDPTDPAYEIAAPNLTPDPKAGILASFTEEAFVDRFKKGGRAVSGSKMPWENFSRMTDDDLKSVYRYLSKVPPAPRLVGPSRRPKGSFKAG